MCLPSDRSCARSPLQEDYFRREVHNKEQQGGAAVELASVLKKGSSPLELYLLQEDGHQGNMASVPSHLNFSSCSSDSLQSDRPPRPARRRPSLIGGHDNHGHQHAAGEHIHQVSSQAKSLRHALISSISAQDFLSPDVVEECFRRNRSSSDGSMTTHSKSSSFGALRDEWIRQRLTIDAYYQSKESSGLSY